MGPWDDGSFGRRSVIGWYLKDPTELTKAANRYLANIFNCDQGIEQAKTVTAKDLPKLLRVQGSCWNWAAVNIYKSGPEEITDETVERMARWFADVKKELEEESVPYIYYSKHLGELVQLMEQLKGATEGEWELPQQRKRLWGYQRDLKFSCRYCNIGVVPKHQDTGAIGDIKVPFPSNMCPECKEERESWEGMIKCDGCGDFDKIGKAMRRDSSSTKLCFWCFLHVNK